MTVEITRLELSAADLRDAAAGTADAKAARRMLAIALVLEGWSRHAAAEACAMDRQTLCDWVHRFNASGLDGLYDRPRRNGPSPRLSAEQRAKLAEWVEQGPELERDGVVRWRCIDLQQRIKREFTIEYHESTVGKLLRRLHFTRLQPRPYHPKKDAAAQEAFKKLCQPGSGDGASHSGRQATGDLVCRRSSRGPERHPHLCLGTTRLATAGGPRQSPRLRLPVRCGVPGALRRGRHHHGGGEQRSDGRALERDQPPGCVRRARRAAAGRCRLAPARGTITGAGQHQPVATAGLRAGALIRFAAQAGREHLGVPARQFPQPPRMGRLRGDPQGVS